MTDTLEKDALALLLRDKTALGRLTSPEVHSVLAYLEGLGWTAPGAAPAPAVAGSVSLVAPVSTIPAAPIAPVVVPSPLSTLASLEATIEKDVKAFFEPAPAS